MSHHRDVHPRHVENCYMCKLLTIGISARAQPTRRQDTITRLDKDERFAQDYDAIQDCKRDKVVPKKVDGCADILKRAEHRMEIEQGRTLTKSQVSQIEEFS